MFSEVLKIIPRLDGASLGKLERGLNARFSRVAKRFGSGLKAAILGGGTFAIVTGLLDKLLNPLKQVQESIEKSLSAGNDLVTYAKQFNTTPGNLARLQAFGRATGLEPEGVRLLLGKFQASVAQAEGDPSKVTSVSRYVGTKDTAEAFFEFIQAMRKNTPNEQNLIQQEVFGEKQILKASEFLNANFDELAKIIGGPGTQQLTADAQWLGQMADNRDAMRARMELQDFRDKAKRINDGTVGAMLDSEKFQLERENARLNSAANLKKLAMLTDKASALIEDLYLNGGVTGIVKSINRINELVDLFKNKTIWEILNTDLKTIGKSRAARGMTPKGGP
jgi:hypothetical protein